MYKIPLRGVSRCLNHTRSIYTHVRHYHSTLVTIQVDSSPSCVVCSETDRLVTLHDCLTSMYIYGHGKRQWYARAASHAEAIDRAKLKQHHYTAYLEYSQNSGCKHTHNTDTHTHTHTHKHRHTHRCGRGSCYGVKLNGNMLSNHVARGVNCRETFHLDVQSLTV